MSYTLQFEPFVRAALLEDLGRAGDITSEAIFSPDAHCTATIVAREAGVVAGTGPAMLAFRLLDPAIDIALKRSDGATLTPNTEIMRVEGNTRAILSAERTALNILGRLCGVASLTARFVAETHGTRAAIVCTRKTTPGMRALEKAAVRAGGGHNHRFGLDDAVLIKDNHIAAAGSLGEAFRRARAFVGHLVRIEVEVDTLAQLDEALAVGADCILLDNMDASQLRLAVERTAGRALLEASGNMSLERVKAVAGAGVDLISVGALTHSASVLDLGLDFGT